MSRLGNRQAGETKKGKPRRGNQVGETEKGVMFMFIFHDHCFNLCVMIIFVYLE
jgi:hypothetical protein